jgi:hypothetical protein
MEISKATVAGVNRRFQPPQRTDTWLLAPVMEVAVQSAQYEYVEISVSRDSVDCSITFFQTRSFTSLSLDEKLRIVEKRRPTPDLHINTKSKCKTKKC